MKHHLTAAVFASAAMLAASAMPAAANVEAGVLKCHIAPSVGYVIASDQHAFFRIAVSYFRNKRLIEFNIVILC